MSTIIHKVDDRARDTYTLCFEPVRLGARVTTSWDKTTCKECLSHRQMSAPKHPEKNLVQDSAPESSSAPTQTAS